MSTTFKIAAVAALLAVSACAQQEENPPPAPEPEPEFTGKF